MANPTQHTRTESPQSEHAHQENEQRANLSDLAQGAREQAEHLKQTAAQYLEEGRERAGQYVDQGREMAAHYIEQGRERAMELEQSFEERIREQPLRAVLTAAGIGFVLGILFSRR